MLRRQTLTLAVLAGTGLAGCTLLYPRFDSLLNPDLAFLNAGDVVDSVKCAVTTFFLDHRVPVETKARLRLHEQLNERRDEAIDQPHFCHAGVTWKHPKNDPKEWRIHFFNRNNESIEKECQADSSVILKANSKGTVSILRNGRKDGRDLEPKTMKELVTGLQDRLWPELKATEGCQTGYHAYKYIRFEKIKLSTFDKVVRNPNGPQKKWQCAPNGGCRPGTFVRGDGKCGLEDSEARLAIDADSSAQIDLTLTAVNTGSMNYQRIDATRLDILGGIIVPGGVAGAAFPTLKATDKKTNKVEISLLMPQGQIREEPKKDFIGELVTALEVAITTLPAERPGTAPYTAFPKPEPDIDRLAEEVRKSLTEGQDEYRDKCESHSAKVGFLGLANYIKKVVTEQEDRIFKGSPEISLDEFVLTSQFQISFDATAGTQNLLRIVPVLQPPVLQLSPDHTHALKITFKGTKGRRTKAKALSILRKCLSRLENTVGSEKAAEFCRQPQAILLESLIDAVENKSSSSAAN